MKGEQQSWAKANAVSDTCVVSLFSWEEAESAAWKSREDVCMYDDATHPGIWGYLFV
jgi:hypothetical protein